MNDLDRFIVVEYNNGNLFLAKALKTEVVIRFSHQRNAKK